MIKVTDYIEDVTELAQLAALYTNGPTQTLLRAASKKLDKVRESYERHPVSGSKDLTENIVWMLGVVAGLTWVKEFPEDAATYLANQDKLGG